MIDFSAENNLKGSGVREEIYTHKPLFLSLGAQAFSGVPM